MVNQPNEDTSHDTEQTLDATIEHLSHQLKKSPADGKTGSDIPAGHPLCSAESLNDIGTAHAINGDGTAVCNSNLRVEQVDNYYWNDVPKHQRCSVCTATLGI